MSILKSIGIAVAILGWCIHLSSYHGRYLRIALAVATGFPMGGLLFLMTVSFVRASSMVNPLAAWWGEHASWKIALAALLLLLFPVAGALVSRMLARFWSQGVRDWARPLVRSLWFRLFCVLLVLYILSIGQVVASFIAWPSYPSAEHMRWAIEVLGYDWIALHPTPAIHHTYATASILWLTLAYLAVLVLARSAVEKLANTLGSEENVKLASFFANVAGSVLAWFG